MQIVFHKQRTWTVLACEHIFCDGIRALWFRKTSDINRIEKDVQPKVLNYSRRSCSGGCQLYRFHRFRFHSRLMIDQTVHHRRSDSSSIHFVGTASSAPESPPWCGHVMYVSSHASLTCRCNWEEIVITVQNRGRMFYLAGNLKPHISHSKFLGPWTDILCLQRVLLSMYAVLHTSHLKGLGAFFTSFGGLACWRSTTDTCVARCFVSTVLKIFFFLYSLLGNLWGYLRVVTWFFTYMTHEFLRFMILLVGR